MVCQDIGDVSAGLWALSGRSAVADVGHAGRGWVSSMSLVRLTRLTKLVERLSGWEIRGVGASIAQLRDLIEELRALRR